MAQTMLLTKRISALLSNNTSPQLHTLLLLSPTGKLLSASSVSPTSLLRTQSTIACSLWNLYTSSKTSTSDLVASALPRRADNTRNETSSILIQLEYGIMVIRMLKCGLLFVVIGPSSIAQPAPALQQPQETSPSQSPEQSTSPHQGEAHEALEVPAPPDPPSSSGIGASGSATPSEAGSAITNTSVVGTSSASILGVRRQAEEFAKWLDGKLEGFVLSPSDTR